MKHIMKLNDEPFKLIKMGTKTIEMRLYDEKRRLVQENDNIEFENRLTGEKLEVEVLRLHIYDSFDELYKNFDKISLGYHSEEIANPMDMEKYYSKEEQN